MPVLLLCAGSERTLKVFNDPSHISRRIPISSDETTNVDYAFYMQLYLLSGFCVVVPKILLFAKRGW